MKKNKILQKSLVILILSFFSKVSYNLLFPFLVVFAKKIFSADEIVVILSYTAIVQYLGTFFNGYISKYIPTKKYIMYILLVRMIFCIVCILYVNNLYIILLTLGIFSLLQGLLLPIYDRCLIEFDNSTNTGKLLSINYWVSNVSLVIGMLMGGILSQLSIKYVMIYILFFTIIELLFCVSSFPKYNTQFRKLGLNNLSIVDFFKSYMDTLKNKAFVIYCFGQILFLILDFSRVCYVSYKLSDYFYNVLNFRINGAQLLSYLTTLNIVIVVCLMPFAIRIINGRLDSFRFSIIFFVACFTYTIGYSLFNATTDILILIISTCIFSFSEIWLAPSKQIIFTKALKNDQNNISCYVALNSLQFLVSKMIAGLLLLLPVSQILIAYLIFLCGVIGGLLMLYSLNIKS